MRIGRLVAWTWAIGAMAWSGAARAQQTVEWTVLVYLNGDTSPGQTNLEDASISDFNELEQIGSTSAMNIVVQWDRNPTVDTLDLTYPTQTTQSWSTARRYLVVKDPSQTTDPNTLLPTDPGYAIATPMLLDIGEPDMGQEDTLVDFFNWTIVRFPARHYLLVLSDGGRGWMPRSYRPGSRGMMFDASTTGSAADTSTSVYFTNTELRSALTRIKTANGGDNLDIVAIDAGGQGIGELVYQCRDTCDYLVATPLQRPLDGFPYNNWLQRLGAQLPTASAAMETMLQAFADDYHASYGAGSAALGAPVSTALPIFRMVQYQGVVTSADALAKALLTDLPSFAPGLLRTLVQVQTGLSTDFSGDFVDLQDFARLVQSELTAANVVAAAGNIEPAITATLVNPSRLKATVAGGLDLARYNGVMLYFPQEVSSYDSTYSQSGGFVDDTQWDELVQGLLTLNSDQGAPVITIGSPLPGSTIIENPPTIVATIQDLEPAGRVNPASITLVLDGVSVPSTAFTFDTATGVLTYIVPAPLTVTSHSFTITARDLSGNLATANGNFRIAVPSIKSGVQTFSLPRILTTAQSDPAIIFGRDNFTMVRWVPMLFGANKYRFYADSLATFLPDDAGANLARPTVASPPAGLGYWVRVVQSRPLPSLPGAAVTANEYRIQLYKDPDGGSGWNMIANPFDVSAISLASTQVLLNDGTRITFRQAIDRRMTPGVLFTYVPNSANPNAGGRYDFQDSGQGQLTRLQGHWLRANEDFTLLVSTGARAVRPAPARTEPAGGWQVRLAASSAAAGADEVTIGAAPGGSDGYESRWDVMAPPTVPGGVALRVVHDDWGLESGRYLRDLRGPAPLQAWSVEVAAPAGEVYLSWPALRHLPAEVELTLEDPTTGRARRLRTTGGYRFDHDGGRRLLRVVAARRSQVGLSLTAVTVTPGRGAGFEVGYTVSRAADLALVVKGLTGRPVSTVTMAAAAGRGRMVWDGRAADGTPVPNGVYQLEVIATASDGATTRQLRTIRVAR